MYRHKISQTYLCGDKTRNITLPSVLCFGMCAYFGVCLCVYMLGGPISSHSPLMFTWSGAAVKSMGRNRELCAHLSLCLQMEGGSFYS